ncbi:MAG: DUF4082 domain-containing protein [bacterium]|nr:DUF4082 domain-containing protein [bacterium]
MQRLHLLLLTAILPPFCAPSLGAQSANGWRHTDQPQASRAHEVRTAWERFAALGAPGEWHVQWSAAAGTPQAIYGPGLRISAAAVEDRERAQRLARDFLATHAALLGTGNSTAVERTFTRIGNTWVAVYDQRFAGLPVIDGRFDVRLKTNGVVALFGSVAFELPADFTATPQLSADLAAANAVAELGIPRRTDRVGTSIPGELVIWAKGLSTVRTTPRLAWQIAVVDGRAFVDATTGAVLEHRHDKYGLERERGRTNRNRPKPSSASTGGAPLHGPFVNVTGTVMAFVADDISPASTPRNVPLGGVRVQVQGGNSAFTDAQGAFDIQHAGTAQVTILVDLQNAAHVGSTTTGQGAQLSTSVAATPGTPATIQLTTASSPISDIAQATAYSLTDRVAEYVRQTHILGNNATLASLDSINVNVMDTSTPCNAFFSGNQISFGIAQSGQCTGQMAFSTVVEHEWGHALDYAFGNITSNDGLSEGIADAVAILFTGQPLIGKDFLGAGQHVRDATNNHQFPTGSGVHEKGQSWMGGCWKARQALIASLGSTQGLQHAEQILIGSIAANPGSQPQALREVFVLDDNDGNLNNGTPNCNDLFASFTTTHSIPSPVSSCSTNPGIVTAYGSGCPGSGLTPSFCEQSNGNGGTLEPPAPTGFVLAYAATPTSAITVTGIELYTQATGSTLTDTVSIHADAGGQPAASAIASLTITLTGTAGWHSAPANPPLQLNANQTYWIVHRADNIVPALVTGGASPATPTLVDPGFGFWLGLPPGIHDGPAWRLSCQNGGQPGAVPTLVGNGLPVTGQTANLDLSMAAPSALALFLLGTSDSQYMGNTLPYSLAGLGGAGCDILAAPEVTAAVFTDTAGAGQFPFVVPNSPAVVDLHVYTQVAMIDPAANALGIAVSNALDLEIGIP